MMRLDFWTWPLPVVNVGPNILPLLRAKLTSSRHHVDACPLPTPDIAGIGRVLKYGCLLWVMSRHRATSSSCPLFPSKRTFVGAVWVSASCQ